MLSFDLFVNGLLEVYVDPNGKHALGNTPLHISAVLDIEPTTLLEMGANPMVLNDAGELPLALASKERTSSWKRVYALHALPPSFKAPHEDFKGILKCIQVALEKKEFVQECCSDVYTPLETVFLLDLSPRPVLGLMTDAQKLKGVELLVQKYPGSHELILRKFFDINLAHMQTTSVLSSKPPKTVPQDHSLILARATGASQEVHDGVIEFLRKVQEQTPFRGTPKAGSKGLKRFYKVINNSLNHLVIYLKAQSEDAAVSPACDIAKKLAKANGQCGTMALSTPLDLFNTYCLNISPSLTSAFFEQLQALRGVLVESILSDPIVNQEQSSHALHYIKHLLGEELKLLDREAYQAQDPFQANGFRDFAVPAREELLKIFLKHYTPAAVYDWLANLMSDHRYRKFYINWAKEHLPPMQDVGHFLFVGDSFLPNPFALMQTLVTLQVIQFKK
jgi:hypothetical protein